MVKKFLLRRNILVAATALFIAVIFVACKKSNDDIGQTPVSALMAFNLVPDQQAVNVALSGNLVGGVPLGYGSYTGTYLNIYSGSRRVESFATTGNQLLDSLTYPFEQGKFYSLFVVGTNNNYKNIVTVDNYDSLTASSGKAYIRYINAISGTVTSNVNVSTGEGNIINTGASFGQVSPFVGVTPGSLNISVSNENGVNASRTISVAGRKAYTVLFMGQPNQSDTTKTVQIRFIENGTVTD